MSKSLHSELDRVAATQGVSMNHLVCLAIATALQRIEMEPLREAAAKADLAARHGLSMDGPSYEELMDSMGYDDPDD
jgi:hypothetical protein